MTILRKWIAEPLGADVRSGLDRLASSDTIDHIAVMPNVHLARDVCVGVVVGSRSCLYPQAVGGDIGCGMATARFRAHAYRIDDEVGAARLLMALGKGVPTNRHSAGTLRETLPEPLRSRPLSHPLLEKLKGRDGRVQFGTLGRGNHFLEFQRDEAGMLWVTVHSGSRSLGQSVTSHHLNLAREDAVGLRFFDAESEEGQAYLNDLDWCATYPRLNPRGKPHRAARDDARRSCSRLHRNLRHRRGAVRHWLPER